MHLVEELNGSTVKARYLRGAGLICQLIDSNTFYYLFNPHGDVVQRIDQSGNAGVEYDYDAFGNNVRRHNIGYQPTDGLDTDPNPFRYCGDFDVELGEIYLRNRSYAPGTGRFTSEDRVRSVCHKLPNGQRALNSLSLNYYYYCRNNPVRYVDSSGDFAMEAALTIGGMGAAIAAAAGAIVAAAPVIVAVALVVVVVALVVIAGVLIYRAVKENNQDDRFYGEPGDVNVTNENGYEKETHIGPDGWADSERHHTDHRKPWAHTDPHDHEIGWTPNGNPDWGETTNYPDGNIPDFPLTSNIMASPPLSTMPVPYSAPPVAGASVPPAATPQMNPETGIDSRNRGGANTTYVYPPPRVTVVNTTATGNTQPGSKVTVTWSNGTKTREVM